MFAQRAYIIISFVCDDKNISWTLTKRNIEIRGIYLELTVDSLYLQFDGDVRRTQEYTQTYTLVYS